LHDGHPSTEQQHKTGLLFISVKDHNCSEFCFHHLSVYEQSTPACGFVMISGCLFSVAWDRCRDNDFECQKALV